MLNGAPLNSHAINTTGAGGGDDGGGGIDWEGDLPIERQAVYLLRVGEVDVPMSSFQATMRTSGQSFLQAVIPAGGAPVDALTPGEPMQVLMGYRYDGDSLSPLEVIASAPLQIMRSDEGPFSHSITVSGYDAYVAGDPKTRNLAGIMSRSISQGRRRVRCLIDLFLRPGHTAVDSDGAAFTAGTIQYFVNAASEAMEVYEDG